MKKPKPNSGYRFANFLTPHVSRNTEFMDWLDIAGRMNKSLISERSDISLRSGGKKVGFSRRVK